MIVGIGTDIVNIERVKKIFETYGDHFINKNFHKEEIICFNKLHIDEKVSYLAKRFAAKEAIAKAFGFGIGNIISFQDIAVINNNLGAPEVKISSDKIPNITEYNINISLSDDWPFAIAFVIISK